MVASQTSRAPPGGHVVVPAREAVGVGAVAAAAARDRRLVREQRLDAVDGGHRRGIDLGGDAARAGERVQVAEEAEAGHVGQRVGAGRAGGRGGARVELGHHRDGGREQRGRHAAPRLCAVVIAPTPSGLVSTSTSPGCPPAFVSSCGGVDDAR